MPFFRVLYPTDFLGSLLPKISDEISKKVGAGPDEQVPKRGGDELSVLVDSFSALENRLSNTLERLERKGTEISALREVQKFVPKEVVAKIIYGEERGQPLIDEFKTLTLLNIDIRGFSKLAKTLGPHRTVPMINYFFVVMADKVFQHHGIVDKYLGNGFLALFSAPVSSASDADNAISAAQDMKSAIDSVSDYFQREVGAPLSIGISIHTDEVGVGNIGFEKKMDYTVVGDAVNTLFRLQALVNPFKNGILLSEKTLKACQSRIIVSEIGEYELDADARPLKVYQLIARDDMSGRDENMGRDPLC